MQASEARLIPLSWTNSGFVPGLEMSVVSTGVSIWIPELSDVENQRLVVVPGRFLCSTAHDRFSRRHRKRSQVGRRRTLVNHRTQFTESCLDLRVNYRFWKFPAPLSETSRGCGDIKLCPAVEAVFPPENLSCEIILPFLNRKLPPCVSNSLSLVCVAYRPTPNA